MDYTKLSNAEINIRKKALSDEYDVKKTTIISLIHELEELDKEFIKADMELKKRGVLNDE